MRFPHILFAAAALPLSLSAPAPLAAQEAAATAETHATIAALRNEVAARYVLPDTAAALDAALGKAEAEGEFAGLTGEALARKATEVMHGVYQDGHLNMMYDPPQSALLAQHPMDDAGEQPDMPAEVARQIALSNGGVLRLELLQGNIRYMDYRGFMWGTPEAERSLATAMEFLRGGDAIVIDLRRNGGGDADAVAAMASYFLPAGTDLMRFEMRGHPGTPTRSHATPFSLAGKPLYVLTSHATFSAAEEFASHVSAFGFGKLVGETTGGGGFQNTFVALPGGFVASISIGRAVHATTGKDWQTVGVAPAIAVAADAALLVAQAEAMEVLATTAPEQERWAAGRLAAFYRAQVTPVDPGHAAADYAGRYGDRLVALDADGRLTVSRGGRPPVALVAVEPDTFVPESSPMQHFRFVTEGGRAVALEVDQPGGPPQRIARQA